MKKYLLKLPFLKRLIHSVILGITSDDCSAKASALTYYSLLSIVPVLAIAFGIAKGFGFEKHLENELLVKFLEQREVVDRLINFAYRTLENTQGGVIAGVGLVVLFWAVLKLFGNIESSFNAIWKIKSPRTLIRKFSDYLSMILFCPIFFAASSSLSLFVVTKIVHFSQEKGFWDTVSPFIFFAFHFFPLVLSWFLFMALYAVMPNAKVPLKYAFIAGVFAGTAYQIVQAIYIQFQIGLSSYGAIYGSFAALPLFLIWLNTSWLIALIGAEIAYHMEQLVLYYTPHKTMKQQPCDLRVIGLVLMDTCIKAFLKGSPPLSPLKLCKEMGVSETTVHSLIQQFVKAQLLIQVAVENNQAESYTVGKNINAISLYSVTKALDSTSFNDFFINPSDASYFYQKALGKTDILLENSKFNITCGSSFEEELMPSKNSSL